MRPGFDRVAVTAWMRRNREDFRVARTGELNLTAMAETAAAEWDQDDEGGPLDDPDHWIWEAAVDVADGDPQDVVSRAGIARWEVA